MSTGILLVAHGSHLNADSSAPVHAHAERVRALLPEEEVRVATWKEEPSLARGLDGFGASDVTVVPVFMARGYFTEEVIPREMRLSGPKSTLDGRTVRYTQPVGTHAALAKVVVERAREAGAGKGDALAVLAHGTPRNRHSAEAARLQAGRIRELALFAEVVELYMDQEPGMAEVFDLTAAPRVVMVPFFAADGWHAAETMPADLGLEEGRLCRGGRELVYTGAAGTHPAVADVVVEAVREARAW